MWLKILPLLISLAPEIVRGIFGTIRDAYAARKAEEERKKAEAENRNGSSPVVRSEQTKQESKNDAAADARNDAD